MNLPQKIFIAIRSLFYPGAAAFNEQRSTRILILAIMVGILLAVGFGFTLFYLNRIHRV